MFSGLLKQNFWFESSADMNCHLFFVVLLAAGFGWSPLVAQSALLLTPGWRSPPQTAQTARVATAPR
ncbi:MAG: hypothetical protein WCO22_16180, partial [Betaproteobacteria bacterium]